MFSLRTHRNPSVPADIAVQRQRPIAEPFQLTPTTLPPLIGVRVGRGSGLGFEVKRPCALVAFVSSRQGTKGQKSDQQFFVHGSTSKNNKSLKMSHSLVGDKCIGHMKKSPRTDREAVLQQRRIDETASWRRRGLYARCTTTPQIKTSLRTTGGGTHRRNRGGFLRR